MRCASCGYQNVSHALKCIKCNEPLSNDASAKAGSGSQDVEVKKTVIGKAANPADFIDSQNSGQPAATKAQESPVTPSKKAPASEELRGTINPWNQARYETIEFVPVAREGQEAQTPATFKSDVKEVVLNRENLDPDNPTITRKAQAALKYDNGSWKLEDKSSIGTFVKISKDHTLSDGDQILMGDRIFTVRLTK